MTSKFWLITGAVLFLGGSSVAVFQIVRAFRALGALPQTTNPELRSAPIGYVMLPVGVAVIGLIIGVAAIAYIYCHKNKT